MTNAAELNEPIRLIRRRLDPAEASLLHQELKSTPNILGYTTAELQRFSDVRVAQFHASPDTPPEFAGACISLDLLGNWTEIAVLYVRAKYRNHGIGGRLFDEALQHARARNRHVYVLSRNPSVIRQMEQAGLALSGALWKAPLAVHLHTQCHLSSIYRMREAVRKTRMRHGDGASFVAGTLRAANPSARAAKR